MRTPVVYITVGTTDNLDENLLVARYIHFTDDNVYSIIVEQISSREICYKECLRKTSK